MTDSDSSAPGSPAGKPRRRPLPTIDLEATELESKPAAAPEAPQQDAAAHAAAQPEAPVQTDQQAQSAGTAAETPSAKPQDWRDGLKTSASTLASRRPNLPWQSFAAAVGGGLIVLAGLYAFSKEAPPNDSARVLDMRLIRVEQQVRELTDRAPSAVTDPKIVEELAGRLAKLETAVAAIRPGAADPATANRIAAIEGEVKAMAETVSVLGRRNDDLAGQVGEARRRADANATAIAELEKKVAAFGSSPVVRGEFDALTGRLTAVEQTGKALEAQLAKRPLDNDRAGRLAVVATALKGAVDRGDPFASELASAKTMAPDGKMLAPLEPFAASGVPTNVMLGRELSLLAPALYQAAGVANRESGSFIERLQANAEKLVRIKPIAEVPGDDPTAVITRIELKAAHSDVTGALAELAKLPATVRAPADAWIKQAEARTAAVDATRRFAADSMAALGK